MNKNEEQQNKLTQPPQHQDKQPGYQNVMQPEPLSIDEHYVGSNKLLNKVAIITGGDSGIGRAIALAYATEGADVVIPYLEELNDAKCTQEMIQKIGRKCVTLAGDIGDPLFCQKVIDETMNEFHQIDIVINNAAEQHPQDSLLEISNEQLEKTFRTNIFSCFYLVKAALPHMKKGSCIINTTSVTAYKGHPILIDYSATKGAIVAFTRSLSQNLAKVGIRVNAVAPGPIWTPLIPASFNAQQVAKFGADTPMQRPGQPKEVSPAFVFLASDDASYITGQVIHVNGGEIVNG